MANTDLSADIDRAYAEDGELLTVNVQKHLYAARRHHP